MIRHDCPHWYQTRGGAHVQAFLPLSDDLRQKLFVSHDKRLTHVALLISSDVWLQWWQAIDEHGRPFESARPLSADIVPRPEYRAHHDTYFWEGQPCAPTT